MRGHRKIGRGLNVDEIRAEATKEEVALEKRKGFAEKVAARKAASGQAGTVKRAAEKAARKAATGQAGTAKRAAGEEFRYFFKSYKNIF